MSLRKLCLLFALCAGLLLAFPAPAAEAATLTVTSLADSGSGSLRDTIAAASPGDIIKFDPSLSGGTITLTSGQLTITQNMQILGLGADRLTISGNNSSRVIEVNSSVISFLLTGVTIADGLDAGPGGAGIYINGGQATLREVHIKDNAATGTFSEGGGILNARGGFSLQFSTVSGNSATFGGGIYNGGTGSLTNVTVSQNSGGGVYNSNFGATGNPSTSLSLTRVTIYASVTGLYNANFQTGTSLLANSVLLVGNSGGNCSLQAAGSGTVGLLTVLADDVTCTGTATSNLNLDPNLSDNGGTTPTHALLSGSSAIDGETGTFFCFAPGSTSPDQRYALRNGAGVKNGGNGCDIGAYEVSETFELTINDTGFYRAHKAEIQVTTQGTLSALNVVYYPQPHPNATGNATWGVGNSEYWTITPTGGGVTFNLSLPAGGATTPKVCKYPGNLGGGGWDCALDSVGSGLVTRNGLTSFSDWAVGNNVDPTAVSLSRYEASSLAPDGRLLLLAALTLLTGLSLRLRRHAPL